MWWRNVVTLEEMFDELIWKTRSRWFKEMDDHYELTLTVPGVPKEDIKISRKNGELCIAFKNEEFCFTLPTDSGNITSKLELGLLTVEIEKDSSARISIAIE